MSQIARPKSDDFTGGWTPTPLYKHVNGVNPNDGGPIQSSPSVQGDACQVKLKGLAWPKPGGPEVLTVRLAGDGAMKATVVLRQGGTPIADKELTPGSSFASTVITLNADQMAAISNYNDLHVELIAGDVKVSCCANALPAVLTATCSGGTGTCSCWNGLSVKLIWDATRSLWSSPPFTVCDRSSSVLQLVCNQANQWGLNCTGPCAFQAGTPTVNCDLPQWVFPVSAVEESCCDGTLTVTVTA
jgi:hypothetical protein